MKTLSKVILLICLVHLIKDCSGGVINKVQRLDLEKRSTTECSTYAHPFKIPRTCFMDWWKYYDEWHGGHDCRKLKADYPDEFHASTTKCRRVSTKCTTGHKDDNLPCCKSIYCLASSIGILLPLLD